MVQEGCPFISALCAIPAQFDPWSRRNMKLSPDGGVIAGFTDPEGYLIGLVQPPPGM